MQAIWLKGVAKKMCKKIYSFEFKMSLLILQADFILWLRFLARHNEKRNKFIWFFVCIVQEHAAYEFVYLRKWCFFGEAFFIFYFKKPLKFLLLGFGFLICTFRDNYLQTFHIIKKFFSSLFFLLGLL